MDLTPELAALPLGRIATLKEQKNLDPDIDENYYWAYFVKYFSPWKDLASFAEEVEGTRVSLKCMLDEFPIGEKEIMCVTENFQVSLRHVAAECEQMIVREDCIAFTAIPKHASFYVQQRYHSPCSKQQLPTLRPLTSDPLIITHISYRTQTSQEALSELWSP